MRGADLIRRLRGSGIVLAAQVILAVGAGVTTAVITEAATGSARYGLWAGSAATVAVTSLVLRNRH